ncbi:sugar phosphate isomerase/epimerase family protein [Clostridium sp. AM58-1XD]|uniref:sugar phosphate isomerase/epimerase family protein n=1 Tax=Clostridium sp. AM58-1XD TaxID=2292307 RepID=UPI000E4BC437|nr:sugar phosphate isomerase/epimerase family protein [Clostridium sp. AM58-1XD]RGY99262.1 sugar phosphate isomerase/epimerase [Clostridium sp. AM58-1XD]
MRFGCCLNMVASRADGTGIEAIKKLADAGYDYAELPLAEMMAMDEREFDRLAGQVERSGISCDVCNNFFPGTMRLTGNKARPGEAVRYAEKALTRAGILGAQAVVFGSGKAKNVPPGFSLAEGYTQVVRLLKEINRSAKKRRIMILIEPLRKAECNLINTYEEGCWLAEDVHEENVKVLVDYYHLTEENESLDHIIRGKSYLEHVHFANPSGRKFPLGREERDYSAFFRTLKECGYDNRISCEAYTADFEKDVIKTLEFFRQITR